MARDINTLYRLFHVSLLLSASHMTFFNTILRLAALYYQLLSLNQQTNMYHTVSYVNTCVLLVSGN